MTNLRLRAGVLALFAFVVIIGDAAIVAAEPQTSNSANSPTVEPHSNRYGTITTDHLDVNGNVTIDVVHNGPTASDDYTVAVRAISGNSVVTAPAQLINNSESAAFLFDSDELLDGQLEITVGNSSGDFLSYVKLDRTPPTVSFDPLSSDPYFARELRNNLRFTGSASDAVSQIVGIVVELEVQTSPTTILRRTVMGRAVLGPGTVNWEADFSRQYNRAFAANQAALQPQPAKILAFSIDSAGQRSQRLQSATFSVH